MKHVVIFVLLAFSALAQDATPAPPRNLKVDCSNFDAAPGCRSYNELVAQQDRDLLGSLGGIYKSYVCFPPNEDIFVLIYFVVPPDFTYQKSAANKHILETRLSRVYYQKFSDGLSKAFEVASGFWSKTEDVDASASFRSVSGSPASASIDEAELSFTFSFHNLEKTETEYTVSVRRSTLRFVETFQAKDSKPEKPIHEISQGGHCMEF